MNNTDPKPKASIYEIIQADFLRKLENAMDSGEKFRWVKPWGSGAAYPCSYDNPDRPFSAAVNFFLLEPGEYLTFHRVSQMHKTNPDIKIRKGAKASYVYQIFPVYEKDRDGNTIKDPDGNPAISRFQTQYIREFHISDIEGLKSHFVFQEYEHTPDALTEMADEVIQNYARKYGIKIEVKYGGNSAYWQTQRQNIVVPDKRQFQSQYEYYSTVFHELGHSTAACTDRAQPGGGKDGYAREELVAELTSALLMAMLRLEDDRTAGNSIAYIQSWHSHIKNAGAKDLYFAASDARKAAGVIMDASPLVKAKLMPEILPQETPDIEKEAKQWGKKNTQHDGKERGQTWKKTR